MQVIPQYSRGAHDMPLLVPLHSVLLNGIMNPWEIKKTLVLILRVKDGYVIVTITVDMPCSQVP